MNEKLSGFLTGKFRISAVETNAYYLRTSTYPLSMQSFLKDPRRPPIPPFFMAVSWRWGGEEKNGKFDLNRAIHIHAHDEEIVTNFMWWQPCWWKVIQGYWSQRGLGALPPYPYPHPSHPNFRQTRLPCPNQVGQIMPTVLLRVFRIFRPSYGTDGFIMNVAHGRHFPSYHEA